MSKWQIVGGAFALIIASTSVPAHAWGSQELNQTLVYMVKGQRKEVTRRFSRTNPFCLWGWCPKFDLIAVSAMYAPPNYDVVMRRGDLITFAGQAWGYGRTNTPNEQGTAVLLIDGRVRASSNFGATNSENVQMAIQRVWAITITESAGRHSFQVCFDYYQKIDEASRTNNCTPNEQFTVSP